MSSSDSSFSVNDVRQYMFLCLVRVGISRLTLLLLLLSSWGVTSGGGSTTSSSWGSSSSATRADVGEQVLDVLALEGLGEDAGPDWLDALNTGSGDQGLELVGL